jgi:prolyl-tRNA synthetase
VKFKDAELIGIPRIVVVGRGLANGVVEVRDRLAGTQAEVPVEGVVDTVIAAVRGS